MKYFYTRKKGFTLVEILIAISILSMSILATFTAVSSSLKSTNFSEDQIIAYYLADEALEFIKNKRDSNSILHVQALGSGSTYPWLSGIAQFPGDPCYPGKSCSIDVPNNQITTCIPDEASCPFLKYDTALGVYNYVTGTATQYKRIVSIVATSAHEILVTVSVSWTAQGISKTHTQKSIFMNWSQ